jgi:hypothetical protein
MYPHFTPLDQHVKELRAIGIRLQPYSYPVVADDEDISFLKQRDVVVDGYTVVVHFSRADYQGLYLDIVSLTGKYMPFLPMNVLCKIAERFLGKKELTFGEFTKNGRKLYSWMVLYKKGGIPIANSYVQNGIADSFNGLEFTRCDKQGVKTPPL